MTTPESKIYQPKERTYLVSDFDAVSFPGIAGVRYCAAEPNDSKFFHQRKLRTVTTLPRLWSDNAGDLSRYAWANYVLQIDGEIIDILKEHRSSLSGPYLLASVHERSLYLEYHRDMARFTTNHRMKDVPAINHAGGCFNFSAGNMLNVWLF